MGRRRALLAAALLVPVVAPGAEAAPYRASCSSGVFAPQVCTFAVATATAVYAGEGQHLVLAPVRSTAARPSCSSGVGWVETYAGKLRGNRPEYVANVTMTLRACPDGPPDVTASLNREPHGGYGYYRGYHEVVVRVAHQSDGDYQVTYRNRTWGGCCEDLYRTSGLLFRRNTGMSADTTGTHKGCDREASALCESDYEMPYRARVDSSISAHWARLQVRTSGQHEGDTERATRVDAQPYGDRGWIITRTLDS